MKASANILILVFVLTVDVTGQDFPDNANIAKFASMVSRDADTLRVRLKNGNVRAFISKKSETSGAGDRYYGVVFLFHDYLKKQGFYVLSQSWQDGDYLYLLVRDRDGYTFSVLDSPILSPNQKYFAMISMDLDLGIHSNAIEMCEFQGDSISLVYSFQPEDWGPGQVYWINDDSLLVHKYKRINQNEDEFTKSKSILMRKNNHWILKDQ